MTRYDDSRNVTTFVAYLIMVLAIVVVLRTRSNILLISFFWSVVSIAPALNIVFWIGTLLAERLLYVPSVGYAIAVGYGVSKMFSVLAAEGGITVGEGGGGGGGGGGVDVTEKIAPKKKASEKKASERRKKKEKRGADKSQQKRTGSVGRRRAVIAVPSPTSPPTSPPIPPPTSLRSLLARFLSFILSLILLGSLFHMYQHSQQRSLEWLDEPSLYESGYHTNNQSVKILNNLAQVLLRDGKFDHAVRADHLLQESTQLLPSYASADFNRGLAHSTLGNKTEAIRYMKLLIFYFPLFTINYLYLIVY